MKLGLVLEGGAMRGLFSAGVMDVLMEKGIRFDGIVGVSAGAAFGCNYKSGQHGRVIRYNKRFAYDPRYCSLWSLIRTGDLFGGEFCYHTLPDTLDLFDEKAYEADPTTFFAVCTDVGTGRAVYQKIDRMDYEGAEYIRASASMPLFAKVVEIAGRPLLDGGIADSIPLQFMQEQGYGRNIVVLTQPEGYRKKVNRLLPIIRKVYKRYPEFIDAMARRHEMYNRELDFVAAEEHRGNIVVVRPAAKLPVEHLTHSRRTMQKLYELGRHEALSQSSEIAHFIEKTATL